MGITRVIKTYHYFLFRGMRSWGGAKDNSWIKCISSAMKINFFLKTIRNSMWPSFDQNCYKIVSFRGKDLVWVLQSNYNN